MGKKKETRPGSGGAGGGGGGGGWGARGGGGVLAGCVRHLCSIITLNLCWFCVVPPIEQKGTRRHHLHIACASQGSERQLIGR